MPLFTFYAFIGHRAAKIPIHTIDHFPNDWVELKELLTDVARKAYNDYGAIEAHWALERHVATRFKVWKPRPGSYVPKPFSHKRNFEALFQMVYNSLADNIEIKQAVFAPHRMDMATEYQQTEKGVKYKIPPIIPKTHKSLLEKPQAVLEELSALRYPDYSRTPKLKYDKTVEKQTSTYVRTYLPWGEKVRERM